MPELSHDSRCIYSCEADSAERRRAGPDDRDGSKGDPICLNLWRRRATVVDVCIHVNQKLDEDPALLEAKNMLLALAAV